MYFFYFIYFFTVELPEHRRTKHDFVNTKQNSTEQTVSHAVSMADGVGMPQNNRYSARRKSGQGIINRSGRRLAGDANVPKFIQIAFINSATLRSTATSRLLWPHEFQ